MLIILCFILFLKILFFFSHFKNFIPMNEIALNSELFKARCSKISNALSKPLICILGKSSDVQEFNMNSALFHYLLGYEFPETILIIQKEPLAFASPRKANILQQIEGLKITVRNKDDSNLESILDMLSGTYSIIDKENIKGDLASKLFSRIKTEDVTNQILKILSIKEQNEIDYVWKSGVVANYLLLKGIDLIRDGNFSKEELENHMDDKISGVNNNLIEFSSDPEYSENHIKLAVRYRGYCTEIARKFLTDQNDEYEIQKYVLGLIQPGIYTSDILVKTKEFLKSREFDYIVSLYTIGLMDPEINFSENFKLENGMIFCLNIDNQFVNTFVLNDHPCFITKKDSKEDYLAARLRFRNKTNDAMLAARIKEHQKELLDSLIEERINFYQSHTQAKTLDIKDVVKSIHSYEKDSIVPRSDRVFLDWDYNFVLVPILSFSVPFHISTIKNVSIVSVNDEPRLRINFKESKEIKETIENDNVCDTKMKFLIVRCTDVEETLNQINEMKKEFNKPKLVISNQPVLKEKFKKYALTDLYMRTDNKAANKKTLGNLELHENGFKYNDTQILFSNIKNVFYQNGDFENRTLLHFNLKEPILHVKPTWNIQFFKKYNLTYHDTSRREDENLELLHEQQEEEELNRINSEFNTFVDRIENETNLKVQIPEKGFLGVHCKEAVTFYLTNECLVSLNDIPFFALNLDEIEIVSFERVTFVTKTFDCIFIFKDKSKTPVTVGSIETTKLSYLKEILDSHNILFMENKVNINWNALLETIMSDPLNFYQNGGWSELLREEEETESEEEDETTSASTTVSSEEEDTTYDSEETSVSSDYSDEDEEDSSLIEEDSEDDYDESYSEESTESSEERPKKRRK